MQDPIKPVGAPPTPPPEDTPPELLPEDFYYEGPYLVFTAIYHRKRGYCCNSDCRHCPYK
jgi:Family of unknown function (DUF5522)